MHGGAHHPRLLSVLTLHSSERAQIVDHPRKYLKPAVAAEKLSVTEGTLANWRWKGIGPVYYAIGSMVRYADADIDAWIAAGRQLASDSTGSSTGERS
jgi:hypothetical protein